MLYLDTEFSNFHGRLISMGIVSDKGGEFYEVLPTPTGCNPWVKEHVLPYLVKDSVPDYVFKGKLIEYLRKHSEEPIIADWPEDLAYLLQYICEPNGIHYNLELDLRLIQSGDLKPVVPHNALSDARALMEWHKLEKG